MNTNLLGRSAVITGASRGIGATVARLLAQQGADIVVNYRSKGPRAEEVAADIRSSGRRVLLAQADLTARSEVQSMAHLVAQSFGQVNVLILNASGGLEKDKTASYAMQLNHIAQIETVDAFLPLMPKGSCIVFVTSHWAHFYGQRPVIAGYEPVAQSKKFGEDALRARIDEFSALGIRLSVVSGDIIEGTITPKLLEREQPGILAARRDAVGILPTIDDFARAIVAAVVDSSQPSGHTVFVGSTD